MESLPRIRLTRRAISDISRCIRFIELHPWGKPEDRERDIYRAFQKIREAPQYFRIEARRRGSGVELRRYGVAQFMVIYAYFPPSDSYPHGLVSIRALRHRRERNILRGVREPEPPRYRVAAC